MADKCPYSQNYGFSSSHVQRWGLDHKEGWAPNNLCFQIVVLEKTLENPLDCKKIKPVNLQGNQPWIFIERTDAEAEAPILWPPDGKSQLIGKDPDAGKAKENRVTEDEMVGWHHWLNGHEFEQVLGDGEAQGSLACSSPSDHKKNRTLLSNWTTKVFKNFVLIAHCYLLWISRYMNCGQYPTLFQCFEFDEYGLLPIYG